MDFDHFNRALRRPRCCFRLRPHRQRLFDRGYRRIITSTKTSAPATHALRVTLTIIITYLFIYPTTCTDVPLLLLFIYLFIDPDLTLMIYPIEDAVADAPPFITHAAADCRAVLLHSFQLCLAVQDFAVPCRPGSSEVLFLPFDFRVFWAVDMLFFLSFDFR